MSFPLPSYAKFNKTYINVLINDIQMIKAHVEYYSYLSNDIQELRKFYETSRFSDATSANHKFHALPVAEKEDLRLRYNEDFNILESIENNSIFSSSRKFIYPYSLNHLVNNFYSNILPTQSSFVVQKMIDSQRFKPRDSYVILNIVPFTKEQYQNIINEWDSSYSFAGVAQSIQSISSITSQYKKDYKYLISKLETLEKENKFLREQNHLLSQQLLKSTTHTWI